MIPASQMKTPRLRSGNPPKDTEFVRAGAQLKPQPEPVCGGSLAGWPQGGCLPSLSLSRPLPSLLTCRPGLEVRMGGSGWAHEL